MNVRESIEKSIAEALSRLGVESPKVSLDLTGDLSHGDYAASAALAYAKEFSMAPRALAEKLVEMMGSIEGVSKIDIAGPGFINFSIEPKIFWSYMQTGQNNGDEWGGNAHKKGKKIVVEYTDPNPFKEFHIGHLVTNAIGESIARLQVFSGAEVRRANYQGDVGRHVARAIWGLMQSGESAADVKALGRAYAAGAAADVDDSPAKQEITEINKKVYARSDDKINDLYDQGRKTSLEHFEELYVLLGTKFDFYFFESETGPVGKKIVESHIEDGIFKRSDGAVVYEGEKHGLHTRVFLNSEGLPTYEAKELGLSKMKYEKYEYDTSIIITGNEVNEYFRVLLSAMAEIFPDLAAKTTHLSHGMMRLPDGKMSSRTGNVVTGESLLVDLEVAARERAALSRAEDIDQLARDVAVAAVKFQILKGGTGKDIIFDRERALSLEGDSGPYLQYTYARTCAIMEKAAASDVTATFDTSMAASDLVRLASRFEDIVLRAQQELEPHLVATYLIQLAAAFNSWYAQEQILDGTDKAAYKVAIVSIVGQTLKNGLWLLGIPAPKRM
jgi:arginyl-tRNA synthetase